MRGIGAIRGPGGDAVSLADLAPGEIYLDRDARAELDARAGDRVRVLAGSRTVPARVKAIVLHEEERRSNERDHRTASTDPGPEVINKVRESSKIQLRRKGPHVTSWLGDP